ncbi:MAG TPA: PAS domain S-box protein, partial [Verrucomicrobiae bacterium]|nr:PAS domain S-box protein [Verrucomicrobiae bacterium]
MTSRPPKPGRPAHWVRYAVAVASVVVALAAREWMSGMFGPTAFPFIFFFPAVAVAAWYGGAGPGALATVLSAAAAAYFFIDPVKTFALSTIHDVAGLAAFIVSSAFILGAVESMHRARARLDEEIDRRQEAQAALSLEKELLGTTLASIGDGVIATDSQGRITFLNQEAVRLTGWPTAEAAGRPLSEVFHIIHEQTRQPAENPVQKVLQTGEITGLANHTFLVSRSGLEIPIADTAAPIRQADGSISGVVLVFRDATVDRKARETSERLAAIVEYSGDVILTKNLEGIIQSWNGGAERLFGYRAEEIVGKPVTVLFPPDRLKEEDHILGRLRLGKPLERLETVRVAKDGRQIPVLVSISPLKDEDGRVIGASKVIHDMTELVAAREELTREKELLATTLASIGD